jgi:hypothetical protein
MSARSADSLIRRIEKWTTSTLKKDSPFLPSLERISLKVSKPVVSVVQGYASLIKQTI